MKRPQIRWVVAALVVLVVLAVIWSRTRPIEVETATVGEGVLRVTVNEEGTTRVRDHADISAPVNGRWVPRAVRPGDKVSSGGTLGAVYPAPMDEATKAQVRAQLGAALAAERDAVAQQGAAEAAFNEATRTLQRLEALYEAGGVALQDVERARTAHEQHRAAHNAAVQRLAATRYEVTSARAAVAAANGNLQPVTVKSPLAGTVLRLFEEHERVVMAGTPLLEVGDPNDLEVVIPVLSGDAARIKEGAAVAVALGQQTDTIRGTVKRVEPAAFTRISSLGVEEQRVNVIATIPSTAFHVGDQFRIQARITVWESNNALRVPTAALMRLGNDWFVFVVDGARARRRMVTVGERTADFAEVREGLAAGDQVVVYPGDIVSDGTRVKAAQ